MIKKYVNVQCLLMLIAVTSYAMENQSGQNELVDLDESVIDQIVYRAGSQIRFYGEYRARKLSSGRVSFPLKACDPLPINIFGDIRYFFLSAMQGNVPNFFGSAIQVDDSTINDLLVVRAKNDTTHNRLEIYLGYDKDRFKILGKKKIYSAILLALATKSTRWVEQQKHYIFDAAKYFTSDGIVKEIQKRLDRQYWGWKKPEFKAIVQELLGEDWVFVPEYLAGNTMKEVFMCDEAVIGNGLLYSRKVYWDQHQNKLKGITYKR